MSGSSNTSYINLLQSGIQIQKNLKLEAPDLLVRGGLVAVGNKLILRVFGGQPIVASVQFKTGLNNKKVLVVNEVESANWSLD